jgi:hypothetical protein
VLFAFDKPADARWTALTIAACLVSFAISGAIGRATSLLGAQTAFTDPLHALAACASGCDGAMPWEFFYPSSFASAYEPLVSGLFTAAQHWGDYQLYAIAPGWAQLLLAGIGIVTLNRTGHEAVTRTALLAIAASVLLALPSHYLGLGLPSLTRIVTAVVPGFEFGAQFAVSASFFVALLAGAGFAAAARLPNGSRRTATLVAVALLVVLDVADLPVHGSPGAEVASAAATFGAPADGRPVSVAFYPMLGPDYGDGYDDLVHTARQHGIHLINENADASSFADLSAPDTLSRLRANGVRYVVVALGDYPRRSEILRAGHILLPEDQDWNSAAWLAPDPTALVRSNVTTRAAGSGTLVLAL